MAFSLAVNDRSPKTYVVLGGHRSGTSFVANCLASAGVRIGGHAPRLEDIRFVQLNMKIIKDAGGVWSSPPSRGSLLESGEKHSDEIRGLVRSASSQYWGWKDPRQVLTMHSYLPHLENDVYLIAIFRKSERSGASLYNLGQVRPESAAVALAKEYDLRLIEVIKEFVENG